MDQMSYLHQNLRQIATFWNKTGKDSSGDPSFDPPKSIKVRWEDRTVVFTNIQGEEAASTSVVFVAEDMIAGDFLFLGTSTTAAPTTVVGAKEVQGFVKTPELVGSGFERRALL